MVPEDTAANLSCEFFFLWLCRSLSGFPGGSAGKESTCNVGDLGSISGLGRFPGEGNSYPLQYSGLENSMDYIVHGVTKRHNRATFTSLTSYLLTPVLE